MIGAAAEKLAPRRKQTKNNNKMVVQCPHTLDGEYNTFDVCAMCVCMLMKTSKINRMWLMACVTCFDSILTGATNLIRFLAHE